MRRILEGVIFLRHPAIDVIKQPRRLQNTSTLDDRGTNLASVLYRLKFEKNELPAEITYFLDHFFPKFSIDVKKLEPSNYIMIVAKEGNLELSATNLPDGLIKMLVILTAVSLEPTLLLIDEPENSLHAQLLEYLVDVLRYTESPALLATHSPILVDLVDPDRIIIVEKDPEKGTVVKKIEKCSGADEGAV